MSSEVKLLAATDTGQRDYEKPGIRIDTVSQAHQVAAELRESRRQSILQAPRRAQAHQVAAELREDLRRIKAASVRYSVTQDLNGLWYAVLHEDGRDFAYLELMHAYERDAVSAAKTWLQSLRNGEHWSFQGAVTALDEHGERILDELLA